MSTLRYPVNRNLYLPKYFKEKCNFNWFTSNYRFVRIACSLTFDTPIAKELKDTRVPKKVPQIKISQRRVFWPRDCILDVSSNGFVMGSVDIARICSYGSRRPLLLKLLASAVPVAESTSSSL